VIYGADEYALHTQDVGNLPLSTPSGHLVALSSIADVKLSSGPEQVNHIERLRAITIQLTPSPDIPLGDALNTINEKIRKPLLQTPTSRAGCINPPGGNGRQTRPGADRRAMEPDTRDAITRLDGGLFRSSSIPGRMTSMRCSSAALPDSPCQRLHHPTLDMLTLRVS
jgi:hypothetical protein